MSSCTRTARAKRCSSDSTSCASKSNKEGNEPCRSLADFIAPKETGLPDHIGAFAVTSGIGLKELCDRFRAKNDDYNAIMAEAIADRLAEAFAECLHKRVRDEWGYGRAEGLSNDGSHSREVSRHQAGRGLPGVPGSHRKGHALAFARCAGEYRNADHRIVCDVAGIERERTLLRAPGIAIFQSRKNRSRPGRRLSQTQRDERGGSRAMARAKPELRPCGIAAETAATRSQLLRVVMRRVCSARCLSEDRV